MRRRLPPPGGFATFKAIFQKEGTEERKVIPASSMTAPRRAAPATPGLQ